MGPIWELRGATVGSALNTTSHAVQRSQVIKEGRKKEVTMTTMTKEQNKEQSGDVWPVCKRFVQWLGSSTHGTCLLMAGTGLHKYISAPDKLIEECASCMMKVRHPLLLTASIVPAWNGCATCTAHNSQELVLDAAGAGHTA
jgi:hypothetical protein